MADSIDVKEGVPEAPRKHPGQDKGYTPAVWTYIGRRLAQKGKLAFFYRNAEGKDHGYTKRVAGSTIGGRYEVYVKDDDEQHYVLTNQYRYLGMDEDHVQVKRWVMEDAAEATAHQNRLKDKDDGANQLAKLTLAEIGRQYRRMPTPQRRALLAVAIQVITQGGTPSQWE